ncbi:MAG: hypothetical protein KF784_01470 [Fimbriimonadaceae bacterium]|nr:hypothetical protein [Fimbriimonadaceae bacterium]
MPSATLGRTNVAFPEVWLSLSPPYEPHEGWLDALVGSALEGGSPIDVSSQPGLWGGALRGKQACLMTIGDGDVVRSTEEAHATSLLQAHLIETLCALGRETIDFYFLRVREPLKEYQITGALAALENAKQEGHVRFIGLCADGEGLAAMSAWQFHDAFEAALIPRNPYDSSAYDAMKRLADERRVGVVTSRPLNWGYGLPFSALPSPWKLRNLTQSFYGLTIAQAVIASLAKENPVLVGVRTPKEVEMALEAPKNTLPDGLDAMLEPFLEAFDDDGVWEDIASDSRAWMRQAAQRRQKSLSRSLAK